mmetsp:Transcript_8322/g.15573  ORF Transcript_8322/g.15573 Transcript_8322/m.15573 type:complete len:324 (-) Transcript_8322:153-1124(-)
MAAALRVTRVTIDLSRNLRRQRFSAAGSPRYFSSSASTGKKELPTVRVPTSAELRLVALRYAIPMVGFGFMDNLVMITAGDAIDQTFGVAFGISTMTAAGFGQCFSDVAGNMSGGMVDAACSRLNLPNHNLTQSQMDLRVTRMCATFGACVGVVTGCLLGMSCLMFMDTDAADRAKRAKELHSVFEHVMSSGKTLFQAERASLFMLDKEKNELWSQVATGAKGIIKVKADAGIIGACVQSGELLNIADAYCDERFNQDVDKETAFHTKSVLAIPVKDEEGAIIGAIEMMNKSKDGSDVAFTTDDENLGRMMASHIKSFIQIVE